MNHPSHSPADDSADDVLGSHLGSALRTRLQTESSDLEGLASAALGEGIRRRRRQRLRNGSVIVGGVAAVAVLAAVTSQIGSSTTAADEPTPAASPSVQQGLQEGQVLSLGDGLTGTVSTTSDGLYVLGSSTLPGAGEGFTVVVSGPSAAIDDWWSNGFGSLTEDWPGITIAVSMQDAEALGMLGQTDEPPVTVGAGWTCEWYLVDDKADCQSSDGGVAGLVIRDAADHAAWANDPDKGASPDVYVTDPHDGIFISVQGGSDTTPAEIQELGESLVWVD